MTLREAIEALDSGTLAITDIHTVLRAIKVGSWRMVTRDQDNNITAGVFAYQGEDAHKVDEIIDVISESDISSEALTQILLAVQDIVDEDRDRRLASIIPADEGE